MSRKKGEIFHAEHIHCVAERGQQCNLPVVVSDITVYQFNPDIPQTTIYEHRCSDGSKDEICLTPKSDDWERWKRKIETKLEIQGAAEH